MTLKLLSYNIRFGGVGRENLLAEVIRESAADLAVLQEATDPEVVKRLARATGMNFWAARPGHSVGFISRIEVSGHEWHTLPRRNRAFMEITLAGTAIRVFGIHLSAVHSNWTERRRVRELQVLLETIKQHQKGFHVLIGDFNTLAPGELFETRLLPLRLRPFVWLSGGSIRWQTIQIMLNAGYVDGYRVTHPMEKGFTFPTWHPQLRLDYVFLPAPFADRLNKCEVRNEGGDVALASDHFPLMADLEVC